VSGKLAVLLPAFNGSHLLRTSVESCARSGLSPDRYGIFVVDNCSTDGSADLLPAFDGNGVKVQVIRNERNLGRVGNWNRALELATEEGYAYATFLFVGDQWIPGGSISSLLDAMETSGSVLGMAPLRIVNQGGAILREGARISIAGHVACTDSQSLLKHSIGTGRLPFAPIQANVYRLFAKDPLVFQSGDSHELNADVEATAAFLTNHPGHITLMADPYLLWMERPGRFFSIQDPWYVFADTRRSLRRLSASTGIQVDWKSANAIAMLTALREPSPLIPLRRRLAFAARVFRFLQKDPAGLSFRRMSAFIFRKLFSRQSYLALSELSPAAPLESSPVAAVVRQCRP
jgi:hypothetical protein